MQAGESKGCAVGEGTPGQDVVLADRQYKMRVAYFYRGGLPPDLLLCCEAEAVSYGHITRELQQ